MGWTMAVDWCARRKKNKLKYDPETEMSLRIKLQPDSSLTWVEGMELGDPLGSFEGMLDGWRIKHEEGMSTNEYEAR